MSFEIEERDIMGRTGTIQTKTGRIKTPALLPVINPMKKTILPKEIEREFRCDAIITNAYILHKHLRDEAIKKTVHKLLDFSKSIMTDSGAYQLLVYGQVGISPSEIITFQEKLNSDIAVILDVPTGGKAPYDRARNTVMETIRRARESETIRTRENLLWVGPIQGGTYLDLVQLSAEEMGKLDFDIHAIGSPTQLMEQYRFDQIVDLIMTAKMNLPLQRPVHLFGAGHPMMFSLAVLLGCDIFDSAAYALYAAGGRYMTAQGTIRIKNLKESICECPICSDIDPKEIRQLPPHEREATIAKHNLYVSLNEIKRIKQAIYDGRLWEFAEIRARAHPKLLLSLYRLKKHSKYLERFTPLIKRRAVFYCGATSLTRPEIIRHIEKLKQYEKPEKTDVMLVLPEPKTKPYRHSIEHRRYRGVIDGFSIEEKERFHVFTISMLFGLIPRELEDVYPLSQHETLDEYQYESIKMISNTFEEYISTHVYKTVVFYNDWNKYGNELIEAFKKASNLSGIRFIVVPNKSIESTDKPALNELKRALETALSN
ncbi:MAG: tRNA guanosine(15) transglycosylase TgtA [Promethearchaeota archaeon]